MFKNILVPTDLTEKSGEALDIALRIGSKDGFRVTLLHVIEVLEDTDDEEFKVFYEKLEARARKNMEDIGERYSKEGSDIQRIIVFGNRTKEIVGYAHDHDIDLIVLSSHKIDKMDETHGWATISYKVGILSHCPVMLVK